MDGDNDQPDADIDDSLNVEEEVEVPGPETNDWLRETGCVKRRLILDALFLQ